MCQICFIVRDRHRGSGAVAFWGTLGSAALQRISTRLDVPAMWVARFPALRRHSTLLYYL
jgi:hypothetical protein